MSEQTFDDIWQQHIEAPLKDISVANGYENDLCWLDGWLVHYADDLIKKENGLFFPSVSAHPLSERVNLKTRAGNYDSYESENVRTFEIEIGLEGVSDRENVRSNMESLWRDVKKSFSKLRTIKLNIESVEFKLPERSQSYAFIIIEGSIKYNSTW